MSGTVHIFPHLLVNLEGHEFQYTNVVAEAFKRRGYEVKIYGSQDAMPEVRAIDGFIPAFRLTDISKNSTSKVGTFLRHSHIFFKDLKKILSAAIFDKKDLIFAHTILPSEFPVWAWCFRRYRKNLPKTVLLLRYSLTLQHRSKIERWLFPYIYWLLFQMIKGSKQLILVTDSKDLAREYKLLTSMPMKVVPIPLEENFSELLLDVQQRTSCHNNHNTYRHLVYLGRVDRSKGFDLLPSLIKNLTNNSKYNCKFTVHCGGPKEQYVDPVITNAFLQLQQLAERGFVRLIPSNISRTVYLGLLCSADIVLIPCRREYYMSQTSNVLIEAFAAGKPAVVPQDTWMASQAIKTGAGTTFESGNVESLVMATKKIIKNFSKYRDAAQSQRNKWTSFHNVDQLVEELLHS